MFDVAYQLLKSAALPPFSLILLGLAGLLIMRRHMRTGYALAIISLIGLYVLSTVAIGEALLARVENHARSGPPPADAAEAIVVLGAGLYGGAPELGGDDVRGEALERLRYAALLHRLTDRPVLLSGGRPNQATTAEAAAMAKALTRDFGVTPRWIEDSSTDTRSNAARSASILKDAGISRIYLVTHAWHMPRAAAAFEAVGMTVVPAATVFVTPRPWTVVDFVPRDEGLSLSRRAIQEWLGRASSR